MDVITVFHLISITKHMKLMHNLTADIMVAVMRMRAFNATDIKDCSFLLQLNILLTFYKQTKRCKRDIPMRT